MIKAQPVFYGNSVADGSIELGQIVDFIVLAQPPDSDAIEIHHEIVSILTQNVAGFEISLPNIAIVKVSQPQRKFFQSPAFDFSLGQGGQIRVKMVSVNQEFRDKAADVIYHEVTQGTRYRNTAHLKGPGHFPAD